MVEKLQGENSELKEGKAKLEAAFLEKDREVIKQRVTMGTVSKEEVSLAADDMVMDDQLAAKILRQNLQAAARNDEAQRQGRDSAAMVANGGHAARP